MSILRKIFATKEPIGNVLTETETREELYKRQEDEQLRELGQLIVDLHDYRKIRQWSFKFSYEYRVNGISYLIEWDSKAKHLNLYVELEKETTKIASVTEAAPGLVFELDQLSSKTKEKIKNMLMDVKDDVQQLVDEEAEKKRLKISQKWEEEKRRKQELAAILEKSL